MDQSRPATVDVPPIESIPAALRTAMDQIEFAMDYTLSLCHATPAERWFEIPSGMPSNIAWQLGHLAVGQYGLLMFRIRGRHEDDLELIPGKFRKTYGKGTTPSADPTRQPDGPALVERLQTVWERAKSELVDVDPAVFLEPVEMPYAAYPNKLGCVLFSPLHLQLHAGQIGMIRRGLELPPVR